MNNDQVQKLKKIFAETLGISDVPDDLSQKNCVKWDSIAQLNLVIAVEEEFGVSFGPEEILAMKSLSVVMEILDTKLPA